MRRLINTVLLPLLLTASCVHAQNNPVVGKWKTVDDETEEPRSVVEIYERDGKLFGKVVKIFNRPGSSDDPKCGNCKGENKNKSIVGMDIIQGLVKDGEQWSGGTILDPGNGESYDCKIWLEQDTLQVRGYVFLFYRTQTWLPYTES